MMKVDLIDDGILWAINRTLLHPRGYALAWSPSEREFYLQGDGSETWRFATDEELGDEQPEESEDIKFRAFEAALKRAKETT